jgi:saccharopine dehydrogenase-like NADP-dependent oxidoreductase
MQTAALGGLGIQGRAALTDLSNSKIVAEVICADTSLICGIIFPVRLM